MNRYEQWTPERRAAHGQAVRAAWARGSYAHLDYQYRGKRSERPNKIRHVVRKLMASGHIQYGVRTGAQAALARHFGVQRQVIHWYVNRERQRQSA